ncbi:MAG: hypothetical protein H7Y09_09860 [Chitinophagaceae bacterium]|nr:hypothetical protein [Anaerolineae bacterium]
MFKMNTKGIMMAVVAAVSLLLIIPVAAQDTSVTSAESVVADCLVQANSDEEVFLDCVGSDEAVTISLALRLEAYVGSDSSWANGLENYFDQSDDCDEDWSSLTSFLIDQLNGDSDESTIRRNFSDEDDDAQEDEDTCDVLYDFSDEG